MPYVGNRQHAIEPNILPGEPTTFITTVDSNGQIKRCAILQVVLALWLKRMP